jgi:hypothetical protein
MNLPTDWQAHLYALRVWLNEHRARLNPRSVALWAGGAVGGLALAVAFMLPQWLDGKTQGRALAAQLASLTGMRVQIEGAVDVALLPSPHLKVNQLRFMSVDGRSTFIKIQQLDLDITLGSLMAGDFVIEDVALIGPELFAGSHQVGFGQLLEKGSLIAQLGVEGVSIEQGVLNVTGLSGREAVSEIAGRITLPNASTLLQAELAAQWRGAPVHLRADLSAPFGSQPSLAQVELDVGAAELSVRLSGMLDTLRPGLPLDMAVEARAGQAAAAWALASSLGLAGPVWADAALQQPLQLSAQIKGDGTAYDVTGLQVALGAWQVKGLSRLTFGAEGGISLALTTDKFDLAAWPSLQTLIHKGDTVIPPRWLAAFDLNAGEVNAGPVKLSNANLKGEIKNGTLSFGNISAVLAGDSRLLAKGSLATRKGAVATLDGQVSLESLQLRDLLTALAVPLPQTLAENSLRQFKFSSDVRGTWNNIGFSGLTASLDGSTITGQISPRRNDGTFAATLAVSQLDLAELGSFASLPAWIWQLPPLSLDVHFDRLALADRSAQNVNVQAELAHQLLKLKQVDAVDFGGNKIRLAGTISPDTKQDVDLTVRLITPDFAALGRTLPLAAQLVPPQLASWLEGQTDLSVRLRRQAGQTQQLTSATYSGGKMDVVVTTRPETPVVWKARVQARETAAVLARLVPGALARPDAILGPFDVYAEGVEASDNQWQVRAIQGQVAGAVLRDGELSVAIGSVAKVDGRLSLDTVNLDLWQQVLTLPAVAQSVSGSVLVQSERVMVADNDLSNVSASLTLGAGGEFALQQLQSNWHEGTLTGSVSGRLSVPYSIKGELTVAESKVALAGGDRFTADGVLDMAVRAEGQGASWTDVVRNLQGDGEFSLDSGTLSGIDFAALTEALLDKRGSPDVTALLERSGESNISSLGGDFNIEDGTLRAPRIRLRTPTASADMTATLELATRRFDSTATISLRELASVPPFELQLTGPLGSLQGRFNSMQLAAYISKGQAARAAVVADAKDKNNDKDKAAEKSAAADELPSEDVVLRDPDMPAPPEAKPDEIAGNEQTEAELDVTPPVKKASSNKPAPEKAVGRGTAVATKKPVAESTKTASAALPARKPTSPTADGPNAPPSIQALLDAMPALQQAASVAVEEEKQAARIAPAAGAAPKVDFAPDTRTARKGGLAPEFSGEAPKPAKDVNSAEVYAEPISPSGFDVISTDGDDGSLPPASVDELLQRTKSQ